MEKRNLTCIGCPMGCQLKVILNNGKVEKIQGNTCKKGAVYGEKEVTNPTRILTSTVRVTGGTAPVVSVKTASDIPKKMLLECMKILKKVEVEAPVISGDILVKNIGETGVDIIATRSVNQG